MKMQPSQAAILLLALACGCHGGVFAKRRSEENCPTDIRKTVPCYPGEDSVFRCPCGPSGNFYGHRPTCWRNWPAPAEAWRDAYCGPTVVEHTSSAPNPFTAPEPIMSAPEPAPAPSEEGLPPKVLPPGTQPGLPGLPPLPGRTTDAAAPQPKLAAVRSGKRSAKSQKSRPASRSKQQVTAEQPRMESSTPIPAESETSPSLVQPVTFDLVEPAAAAPEIVVPESLQVDASAAGDPGSSMVQTPLEPSPLPDSAPRRHAGRPILTGFVR